MENINTPNPTISTMIVCLLTPFHSFNTIPQTLLNSTFRDINILHEKAIMIPVGSKKLFPTPNPKNCEYHKTPAKAQNNKLLPHTEPEDFV